MHIDAVMPISTSISGCEMELKATEVVPVGLYGMASAPEGMRESYQRGEALVPVLESASKA